MMRRVLAFLAELAALWLALLFLFGLYELVRALIVATWLYHPLGSCTGTPIQIRDCKGYNFVSGIGSDFGEVTLITGLIAVALAWWHQHNCHVDRCPRLQFHAHPEHGHPTCKKHFKQAGHEHTIAGEVLVTPPAA